MTDSIWLFRLVTVALVSEIFLSVTWNPFYFRYGIPVFRKVYSTTPGFHQVPSISEIEQKMKSTWSSSIVFRDIGSLEYAFREKLFELSLFHATPVMHGLLRFDSFNGQVVVVGHINWFVISAAVIMSQFVDRRYTLLVGMFIVVIAACYLIQLRRFSKVGRIACELWTTANTRTI